MCLISIFLPSLAQCWFGAGAQLLRVEGGRREGWKEGQKEGGKDGRRNIIHNLLFKHQTELLKLPCLPISELFSFLPVRIDLLAMIL